MILQINKFIYMYKNYYLIHKYKLKCPVYLIV